MNELGNLLDLALGAISHQSVKWFRFTGRTTNAIGYDVATYAAGRTIQGSMQAVPRNQYKNLGLDFRKNYANLYASADIIDVSRGGSGDYVSWDGRKWQVESVTDWLGQDGWKAVFCVDIGAA
jgi:hypothetical protein